MSWSPAATALMGQLAIQVQIMKFVNWSTKTFGAGASATLLPELIATGHIEDMGGGQYRLTASGITWAQAYKKP